MYGKLYLVDRLLVYVQYFNIRYLMCAVMTNYIVYCMHALTVKSRPKLYIFNRTLTLVSLFLNLCSSEIGTCPLIHPNWFRCRSRYLFYRNMTAMTSLWRIVSHFVQFSKWTSGPRVIYTIVFATWRQCARLCDTWFLGSHESTPNGVCITLWWFNCFTTAASRLSIVFASWHHCAPPRDAFPGVDINK